MPKGGDFFHWIAKVFVFFRQIESGDKFENLLSINRKQFPFSKIIGCNIVRIQVKVLHSNPRSAHGNA